jgi:puromycin-sensitive aminopeptidase
MGDLATLIEYTDYTDQFKKYRLNLFSAIQKKLGWDKQENENPLVAMLRPMVLNIMGKSGDQAIIDEARKRFQQHIQGDLIDPNIRGAVYAMVSRYGDETTQEELRKLYKAADMTEEKVRLLRSMGQSNNPDIIEKTLDFVFEGVCTIELISFFNE